MKVTKEFRIVTAGNIDEADPSQFPTMGWKVSIDGTQLGNAYWWRKDESGEVSEAETLAAVLREASEAIKHHARNKC